MSCKISRRNFMKCAGVGALALASSGLLTGCNKFGGEYGLNDLVSWTVKDGSTVTMKIAEALEITAENHDDMAKDYQLKVDKGQRYIYLRVDIQNESNQQIELYNERYSLDWFEGKYTDEKVRDYVYTWEKDAEDTSGTPTYPNANQMVKLPAVIWAYSNGMYLNDGKFGAVCYTGTAGEPTKGATYANIPTGPSYVDCIGQITEKLQTFRVVYRLAGKEINFVIYPSQLG